MTLTYISWSNDFALHLKDNLKYEPSYFGIVGQYDMTFDHKINVGLCDVYLMAQ